MAAHAKLQGQSHHKKAPSDEEAFCCFPGFYPHRLVFQKFAVFPDCVKVILVIWAKGLEYVVYANIGIIYRRKKLSVEKDTQIHPWSAR